MQLKCSQCGEYRIPALHKKSGLCHNCRAQARCEYCLLCGNVAPYELHHIIPQHLKASYLAAKSTIPLCLNCHKCVTKQYYELFWIGIHLKQDYGLQDSIHDAMHALMMVWQEREELLYEQARNHSILESTHQHENVHYKEQDFSSGA